MPVPQVSEFYCQQCLSPLTALKAGAKIVWKCLTCEPYPDYLNTCWNCGSIIDSNKCQRAEIRSNGYVCNHCGKDLSYWKEFSNPFEG